MMPEAQAKAEAGALRLEGEMDLAEVRRALKVLQEEIGQTLQIEQGSVARIEKRADISRRPASVRSTRGATN